MTLRRRIKARSLFARTRKHRSSVQLRELPVNVRAFLEVEKPTFNFIKLLSAIFFSLNVGSMAIIFTAQKYKYTLLILTIGMAVSLFFMLFSLSFFKKSLFSAYENADDFIKNRIHAHNLLHISVYFCLVTFLCASISYTYHYFSN